MRSGGEGARVVAGTGRANGRGGEMVTNETIAALHHHEKVIDYHNDVIERHNVDTMLTNKNHN